MHFHRIHPSILTLVALLVGLTTVAAHAAPGDDTVRPAAISEGIFFTANVTSFTNAVRRMDLDGANESVLLGPIPVAELLYHDGQFYGPAYDDTIRRMDPDGTNVETLIEGLDGPNSLQIDIANGKMYWFDQGRLQVYGLEVRRANLDGSDMEIVIPDDSGLGEMASLTISPATGKLYVVDWDESIRRANLDGTDIETVFTPTAGVNPEVRCIAVDADNNKIYWVSDGGSSGNFIGRADLDGSNSESLIPLATFPDVSCPVLDSDAGILYWGDGDVTPGVIRRADLDGTNIVEVVQGEERPNTIFLGPNNTLYWMDRATASVAPILMRAGRDGSNPETVLDGFGILRAMAIVPAESTIFWLDQGTDRITLARADLDGDNVQTIRQALRDVRAIAVDRARDHIYLSNSLQILRMTPGSVDVSALLTATYNINAIALDLTNDKIYWASGSGGRNGRIDRADLDGSNVEEIYVVPGNAVHSMLGLAVDVVGNRLFWSYSETSGAGSIWQAELDGSDPAPLIENLGFPRGVDLDLTGGHIYWVDSTTDKVQRAGLDGENMVDVVTSGLSQPYGLVVDAPNGLLYWSDTVEGIQRAALNGSNSVKLYDGPAFPYLLAVVADAPDGDTDHSLYLPLARR